MAKTITLTFKLTPAEDIENCVVAEIPELGLVTQGDDDLHAFEMALEAAHMIVEADRASGLDPLDRSMGNDES